MYPHVHVEPDFWIVEDDGTLSGEATFEIDDGCVQLINLKIGGLTLTRYDLVKARDEATISLLEDRFQETWAASYFPDIIQSHRADQADLKALR